jgi:hypothetical protein
MTKRSVRNHAIIHSYKSGVSCLHCGTFDNLTFHHRDPTQKKFTIGQNGGNKTVKQLKAEIAKCDLVCRTCHDKIHNMEKKVVTKFEIIGNPIDVLIANCNPGDVVVCSHAPFVEWTNKPLLVVKEVGECRNRLVSLVTHQLWGTGLESCKFNLVGTLKAT